METDKEYMTQAGTVYTLIQPAVAKGGEGSIYQIEGQPKLLAKIFSEKCRNTDKSRKIEAMMELAGIEQLRQQTTWPIAVLYENGILAGYLMGKLDGYVSLGHIYSDSGTRMTYAEKVRVCQNICAAVNTVHEAGQICGDLNPNNIMVNLENGMVRLVDTDSYHIITDDRMYVYRCEVGMPDYLPPELLVRLEGGKRFQELELPTFTVYSDRFALGVLIFALLMNGCHPFACAAADDDFDSVIPQVMENIKNRQYYFELENGQYLPPRYAPPIRMLTEEMRTLFSRCFVGTLDLSYTLRETDLETELVSDGLEKARPTEADWYDALMAFRSVLVRCSANSRHIYPDNKEGCPWCRLHSSVRQAVLGYQKTKITEIPSKKSEDEPMDETSENEEKNESWRLAAIITITAIIILWIIWGM